MSLLRNKPGIKRQLTQEEFLRRCAEAHGTKFSYEKAVYQGFNRKVVVICKIHGDFEVTPNNHINLKSRCPECRGLPKNTVKQQVKVARYFVRKRKKEKLRIARNIQFNEVMEKWKKNGIRVEPN